jgi:hypothetical protein
LLPNKEKLKKGEKTSRIEVTFANTSAGAAKKSRRFNIPNAKVISSAYGGVFLRHFRTSFLFLGTEPRGERRDILCVIHSFFLVGSVHVPNDVRNDIRHIPRENAGWMGTIPTPMPDELPAQCYIIPCNRFTPWPT